MHVLAIILRRVLLTLELMYTECEIALMFTRELAEGCNEANGGRSQFLIDLLQDTETRKWDTWRRTTGTVKWLKLAACIGPLWKDKTTFRKSLEWARVRWPCQGADSICRNEGWFLSHASWHLNILGDKKLARVSLTQGHGRSFRTILKNTLRKWVALLLPQGSGTKRAIAYSQVYLRQLSRLPSVAPFHSILPNTNISLLRPGPSNSFWNHLLNRLYTSRFTPKPHHRHC